MNILIADDTKTEQFFLSSLFQKSGIKPDIANGGKDAIKMSSGKKYDIIFLDTDMPEPDGVKTCQRIRRIKDCPNLKTPIVYMGSVPSESLDDNAYVIKKPISNEVLLDMINTLMPGEISPAPKADAPPAANIDIEEEDAYDDDLPDELKNLLGLDISEGITHCGSEEGLIAALDIFYSTITQKADEIQSFYENEDYESYTIKVHALKSSARIIGASKLADDAFALETAGKENDIDTIKNKTDDLLKDYRNYLTLLAPLNGGAEAGSDESSDEKEPNIPPDVLEDAYRSIGEFSDAMDFDLTEMVIKSLDEYILPKEDAKKVANIRTKLLNLDWHGIQEILGDN